MDKWAYANEAALDPTNKFAPGEASYPWTVNAGDTSGKEQTFYGPSSANYLGAVCAACGA